MLKETIIQDRTQARLNKDTNKIDVLTMVQAGIEKDKIKKGSELTEEEVQAVIAREVKQINEVIELMKTPIQSVVDACNEKIEILKKYLPQQLTEEEINQEVKNAIIFMVAADAPIKITKQESNQIRKVLMPRLKGIADGKLVSKIIDSYVG
jgi:uncharacterized protein YqeY